MKRIVIKGFLIWLAATVALRFAGQWVFRAPAIALLAISLPLMVYVAIAVLRHTEQRALGAIALVAPGMLLDTISTIWFAQVFPNIRTDAAPLFGGWLLFCNVVVLLTAMTLEWRTPSSAGVAKPR
jgi:hypothetical protein